MRIKKDPTTKNEYISANGVWVRNFVKECVTPINLSPMTSPEEYARLLENEHSNRTFQISNISDESLQFRHAVIVSDGYDFDTRHKVIAKFPADVAVIAVNGALSKWTLMEEAKRPVNLYVVNNPYAECMRYMPKGRYYPTCVASTRTNPSFSKKYKGRIYHYEPTPARTFGVSHAPIYFVDDYRNPICAAIGLAYRFGVEKLMLLCCDDSFRDRRDASVVLENGLYTYTHHIKIQSIIDANLYWFRSREGEEIVAADYSDGPEYKNAVYIANDEEALNFF